MSPLTVARHSAVLMLTVSVHAMAQTQAVAINIPSQALSSALLTLSQQTGVQIAFSPEAVNGKHAAALRGTMRPADALNQLLRSSGLTMRADGAGRFQIIVERNPLVPAALDPVRVVGESTQERVYTQEEIAATPTANRDISALIATNPAVRVGNNFNSGANRGSMETKEISFHGSSPYQNQFQIDGVGANNRLDPANDNLNLQVGNIPGTSQAYAIDTALLDQVRVYDSGIPIEYGHFTGGVVDARLRRPSGENHLEVNYRWNSSNLTKQAISEYDQENWQQGTPGFSPEWTKRFYTVNGEVAINDKLGAIVSASRRESTIQRYRLGTASDPTESTQDNFTDRVDNFLSKFSLKASPDTVSDLTLKFSDRREELVSNSNRDTAWENRQQARGIAWNLEHSWDSARLQVQAGWDDYRLSRDSEHTEFVTHQFVDNRRQYSTGGFGKEEKQQQTMSLSARLDLAPLHTGVLQHNVYAGLQAERIDFNFKRYSDLYSYRSVLQADGSTKEYSKVHYLPGNVDRRYYTLGAYMADRIQWDRFAFTGSARIDRDTLLGNVNVSPRTRLDWDAFGNGQTVLSAGWSRYYGAEILNIAMQEDISKLSRQLIDGKGNPIPDGARGTLTRFGDLRTPYDDEWAIQLTQRFGDVEGKLSYVRRNGRDQITRAGDSLNGYEYVNEGNSTNDTYSLGFATLRPWVIKDTYWTARADISYQRSKRNADLVNGYEDTAIGPDDYIYYNGKRIRAIDKPASNFNVPYTAHLQLTGYWPKAGLTWDNTLNWQSSRKDIFAVGLGPAPERLRKFESGRIPSIWTWDTRIAWEPQFAPNLTLSVDVLNVLNKTPKITSTNPNFSNDRSLYRVGREIWLQVGYRF